MMDKRVLTKRVTQDRLPMSSTGPSMSSELRHERGKDVWIPSKTELKFPLSLGSSRAECVSQSCGATESFSESRVSQTLSDARLLSGSLSPSDSTDTTVGGCAAHL